MYMYINSYFDNIGIFVIKSFYEDHNVVSFVFIYSSNTLLFALSA